MAQIMTKRGRKSSAALAVRSVAPVGVAHRPAAPDELGSEEAQEWQAIVNRLPADWFARETHSLLIQYCRHIVTARRVRQMIDKLEAEEDFDFKSYEAALKMQARESQIITTLATKMRISQQSTYDKSKQKGKGGNAKPWDV
jgi:hypothetical protein